MKPELTTISDYVISYNKITDETPFVVKEIDAKDLLIPSRFDLSAKLYYIDSYVTGKNQVLATALYDAHIAAFQNGIIEEHGNRSKKGFEAYHLSLENLVDKFLSENYDGKMNYIPVDQNMRLLDGAHRTACSIYFNQKVPVIIFPTIKTYNYDQKFFRKQGLEKGYLDMMEYVFFTHKKMISDCFSNDSEARNHFGMDQKEAEGKIIVTKKELFRCRTIRFFRKYYTYMIILIKKILRLPV